MDGSVSILLKMSGQNALLSDLSKLKTGVKEVGADSEGVGTKVDQLLQGFQKLDRMSLGGMRRELRQLKNIPTEIMSDDQVNQVEGRMAGLMHVMREKNQELRYMSMRTGEVMTKGFHVVTGAIMGVSGALQVLGVEKSWAKKLEEKILPLFQVVHGLTLVTEAYRTGLLRGIAVKTKDAFLTARQTIANYMEARSMQAVVVAEGEAVVATTTLGIVMSALMGPIGLIALAVGGLILAYKALTGAEEDVNDVDSTPKLSKLDQELAKVKQLNDIYTENISILKQKSNAEKGIFEEEKKQSKNLSTALDELFKNTGLRKVNHGVFDPRTGQIIMHDAQKKYNTESIKFNEDQTKKRIDGERELFNLAYSNMQELAKTEPYTKLIKDSKYKDYMKIIKQGMHDIPEFREKTLDFSGLFNEDKKGNMKTTTGNKLSHQSTVKELTINVDKMIGVEKIETTNLAPQNAHQFADAMKTLLVDAIRDGVSIVK